MIAGSRKGLKLTSPKNDRIRPTSDRIKELIFSVVRADGCCVLDLFAGSGSLGIEALSRGAVKAIFIDNNRSAVGLIRRNLEKTRFFEEAKIMHGNARQCLARLARQNEKFDLILMDPPYREDVVDETTALIAQHGLLPKAGWLVVETSATANHAGPPGHYSLKKDKVAGDTRVSFFTYE